MEDRVDSKEDVGAPPTKEHARHHHDRLLRQVSQWLEAERVRRASRKTRKQARKGAFTSRQHPPSHHHLEVQADQPRASESSEEGLSLQDLQEILTTHVHLSKRERQHSITSIPRRPSYVGRRRSSRSSRGFVSSDTEYQEGDAIVPSCDVILDNSKTMAYTLESSKTTGASARRVEKEKEAWMVFKNEIVRLAHTLRLKGWRRVPLDRGCDIEVKRLSGALTNAVYVVTPPQSLPSSTSAVSLNGNDTPVKTPRRPAKLLLRIYGPQVEHLIDREKELDILRRLARKRIGPRLLGTFRNGRFEQFFEASTLTAKDLRVPETSKKIAKRMRELHDGIELLPHEREEGPFVWQNWDKWLERCEEVVTFLDQRVKSGKRLADDFEGSWQQHGFVCGVEWALFKRTLQRYRSWLEEKYGGSQGLRERLVFAHNDVSLRLRECDTC